MPNAIPQKRLQYAKISDTPFDKGSLIQWEAWCPGGPRIPQNPIFFWKNGKHHPKQKNLKMSRNMPKLAIRSLTGGL